MTKNKQGVTILELMVVVVIIATVAAFALPNLTRFSEITHVDAAYRELTSSLSLARSEAVKLSGYVTVCPSNNGTSCLSAINRWDDGWIIFSDHNHNTTVDSGDTIVRVDLTREEVEVRWTGKQSIIYQGDGSIADSASVGVFHICSVTRPRYGKAITIYRTGIAVNNTSPSCP